MLLIRTGGALNPSDLIATLYTSILAETAIPRRACQPAFPMQPIVVLTRWSGVRERERAAIGPFNRAKVVPEPLHAAIRTFPGALWNRRGNQAADVGFVVQGVGQVHQAARGRSGQRHFEQTHHLGMNLLDAHRILLPAEHM